ncbi:MAG: spore protease YyaC [Lachnospiraceae bacterium]|nr:spore protease YyaC [Lachnospiraceae bacterium]
MKTWNREIYYYDTAFEFEAELFAGHFLNLLLEEMKRQKKSKVMFLCIGTDRSTGDSLGPLIGYKLMKQGVKHDRIIGTLEQPVHALNLEDSVKRMEKIYYDSVIVAVDASVGNVEHIGYITLGRGSLRPGLGVRKNLDAVGDIFITGIVGASKDGDPLLLQNIRLSLVMRLADCISKSLLLGMSAIGKYVDNFFMEPTLL